MAQNYNIEQVRSAIIFALHTVPSDSLEALFAKFGYTADEISVDVAMAAWKRYGNEFMIPFAELAQGVLNDPEQMAEIERHYKSIARANGTSEEKTSAEKWEDAKKYISDIFGLAAEGYVTYKKAKDAGEETEETEAAETDTEEQTESKTPWLAIGVGAAVLILIVVLIVVIARKK